MLGGKRTIGTAIAAVASAGALLAGSPASAATATAGASASGARLATTSSAVKPNVVPNASVSFKISNVRCYSNGITFTARTQENGRSGVQQFKQKAVEQEFTNSGWVNITNVFVYKSAKFPNDSRNFYYQLNWKFSHPANGASYRVLWQGLYLNGAGRTIYKTKVIKINCL